MRKYQDNWMADSSKSTRRSQWKHYFSFCEEYNQNALPASLDTILLYLAYMASSFKYVSIINYLSAVWVLHKMSGFKHIDSNSFEIYVTLRGIRRTIGDVSKQARPLSVHELLLIYSNLDLRLSEDLALWCAIIMCFRGLFRKSNIVEEGIAVLAQDVSIYDWGVLIRLRRTKTISFRERILEFPFSNIEGSPFCVKKHLLALIDMVHHSPTTQLISYFKGARVIRGTYSWLASRLHKLSKQLRLESFTSHSLRRGGASAMAEAGFSLIDITNLGDWSSMSVLLYLTKSPQAKLDMDIRVSQALFN